MPAGCATTERCYAGTQVKTVLPEVALGQCSPICDRRNEFRRLRADG